jgi:3D (Asp-Asp-Asp) domain-containing protein
VRSGEHRGGPPARWPAGRRRRPAKLAAFVGIVAAAAVPASIAADDSVPLGAPSATAPAGIASPSAPARPAAKYRIRVDAVAYHLPGRTALGIPVRVGVVAVDPKLIPLGTRLHVPGYGPSIAADVGTAIKGRIIDLWMPNDAAARRWGRKTVTITVFR